MQAVKLKVKITSDHRVYGTVPDDVPQGEAEAVVMYHTFSTEEESGVEHLLQTIARVQKKNYPQRSMDEIMIYVNRERDSWEADRDLPG